ncbi:MAG: hypothetical protein IJP31_02235, partial [Lachnospiraceae bacterium]|nr:hypothetical protein [Lachnospiraceae bacterium]
HRSSHRPAPSFFLIHLFFSLFFALMGQTAYPPSTRSAPSFLQRQSRNKITPAKLPEAVSPTLELNANFTALLNGLSAATVPWQGHTRLSSRDGIFILTRTATKLYILFQYYLNILCNVYFHLSK